MGSCMGIHESKAEAVLQGQAHWSEPVSLIYLRHRSTTSSIQYLRQQEKASQVAKRPVYPRGRQEQRAAVYSLECAMDPSPQLVCQSQEASGGKVKLFWDTVRLVGHFNFAC